MPDTQPGATVGVVENPYNDPVTVAYSALDSITERAAAVDDETVRLADKLKRAQADVEAAKGYVAANKELKAQRAAEVKAAQAEVDKARDANPDLATQVEMRRDTERRRRRTELEAELARIKKGG